MYDGHADAPEAANARHHRLLYLAADVFVLRGKVDHGLHVRHAAEQIFAPRFVSLMQRACVVDVRVTFGDNTKCVPEYCFSA